MDGFRHTLYWFPSSGSRRYTQVPPSRKCSVIPAGMQESRAMEGNSPLCKRLIQGTHQPADSPPCDWIPAVHAGMTGFNHLCITTRAGAWEPAQVSWLIPLPLSA